MIPTRSDIAQFVKERDRSSPYTAHNKEYAAGLIKRAQLHASELVNDQAWDEYLSTLKDKLNDKKVELENFKELLSQPVSSHFEREKLLAQRFEAEGCVATLEYCMKLPKEIMDLQKNVNDTTN